MDQQSIAGGSTQPPTDVADEITGGLEHHNAPGAAVQDVAHSNLQAASEHVKTAALVQSAVNPSIGTLSEDVHQYDWTYVTPSYGLEGPAVPVNQQIEQPAVTAQSEDHVSQQQLRRSTRERRKPAVLNESADEEALTAAAYAPAMQHTAASQQDDPFSDLMLLIETAAALSTAVDAGLDSPSSEAVVRAGSVGGSHQSSSSNTLDEPSAVAGGAGEVVPAAYDAASGMAALAIHRLSAQGPGPNSHPKLKTKKSQYMAEALTAGQLGRSSSSSMNPAAGLPPAAHRNRKGTPPADGSTAAAASKCVKGNSSRKGLAGLVDDALAAADAPQPVPKRSSEATGSLPNLKPRGQGRWQVFLCAQGLKYLYVGQVSRLGSLFVHHGCKLRMSNNCNVV